MAVNLDAGDLTQLVNLVRTGNIRDASGFGNNIANPTWGAEGYEFIRLTDPYYLDGASTPRTTSLSPRQISDIVSTQDNDGSGSDEYMPNPYGGSGLLAYFGQYFDHGLDFIGKGLSGTVSIGSSTFPMNVSRGNIVPGTGIDPDGIPNNGDEIPTEYINKASPFADLSQVYGSHDAVTDLLRVWTDTPAGPVQSAYLLNGDLDSSGMALLPTLNDVRENYRIMTGGNELTSSDISNYDGTNQALLLDFIPVFSSPGVLDLDGIGNNFVAGDGRANENIVLTSIHTVWHRNHNFWVDKLKALTNNSWTEEEYFETARIMNFSEYQRVVFDEFADALIGGLDDGDDHAFEGYDPLIDPSVTLEFAQAAYRLGHSMINNTVSYLNSNGQLAHASLSEAFLNPQNVVNFGVDNLLAGQAAVPHQTVDMDVVDVLRNQLLGQPTDLASLNIFRGRDVGIAPFNEIRAQLYAMTGNESLRPYSGWQDFQTRNGLSDGLIAQLQDAYPDGFETMDLWVGGLSERPVQGPAGPSQLGSTLTWIVADQLLRLQSGDRFYYLEILDDNIFQEPANQTSFADIIERNTGLTGLPDLIFQSAPVPTPNAAPSGRPTISDTSPTEMQLLTASSLGIVDPDGMTGSAVSYRWQVSSDSGFVSIAGATGASFTPGAEHIGQQLRVIATYADDSDHVQYVTSLATRIVGDFYVGTSGANTFNGTAGDDTANGLGGNDTLNGNAGSDLLIGGAGADRLNGGAGSDTLFGDAGNDILDGGGAPDEMIGGRGNDTYYVNFAFESVVELMNEGTDRVFASASYALFDNVENLTLTGSAAIDGTGNDLANILTGNAAANILDGLAGNDTLRGNGGNDTLLGGAGLDQLLGGGGADVLDGGEDNDTMTGGGGADTFRMGANFGQDQITDFDSNPTGGQDRINVGQLGITAANFASQVSITDAGADTLVTIGGNSILLLNVSNHLTVTVDDFGF